MDEAEFHRKIEIVEAVLRAANVKPVPGERLPFGWRPIAVYQDQRFDDETLTASQERRLAGLTTRMLLSLELRVVRLERGFR